MLTTTISSTPALAEFCARMAHEPFIAVDTEFLRETTYWPILCLIQVAGAKEAAAIDAMANIDLTPFYDLMKNNAITKVFHAARQDLEIIWKACGELPKPLFDSQIAAQALGFGESIGYGDLVHALTGVELDKANRYTDWTKRPLTKAQLDYALADVTHLHNIYTLMLEKLTTRKRGHWMQGEIESLLDENVYLAPPDKAYERLASKARKPRELAVLIGLCEWRESEAQRRNLARSRMIKDDVVLDIMTRQPTTPQALAALRSVQKGFENSEDAKQILEVVRQAMARDPATLPPLTRQRQNNATQRATLELMRVLLKAVSENEEVAPRILASSDDLEHIVSAITPDCPALHGWRREIFGEKALLLKNGKLALVMKNGRVDTLVIE